jgi:hypothetical protein
MTAESALACTSRIILIQTCCWYLLSEIENYARVHWALALGAYVFIVVEEWKEMIGDRSLTSGIHYFMYFAQKLCRSVKFIPPTRVVP